jgi:hypothetical protein
MKWAWTTQRIHVVLNGKKKIYCPGINDQPRALTMT